MSIWGRIFAAIYDPVMGRTEKAGLTAHRQALLTLRQGNRIDAGVGAQDPERPLPNNRPTYSRKASPPSARCARVDSRRFECHVPQPTLADIPRLVEETRRSGAKVDFEMRVQSTWNL